MNVLRLEEKAMVRNTSSKMLKDKKMNIELMSMAVLYEKILVVMRRLRLR